MYIKNNYLNITKFWIDTRRVSLILLQKYKYFCNCITLLRWIRYQWNILIIIIEIIDSKLSQKLHFLIHYPRTFQGDITLWKSRLFSPLQFFLVSIIYIFIFCLNTKKIILWIFSFIKYLLLRRVESIILSRKHRIPPELRS